MKHMNIIARKPREGGGEYIVVDRSEDDCEFMPFVVASANEHSLKNGEWFWGSYYRTRAQAFDDFNKR